jgi:hypothetical protein
MLTEIQRFRVKLPVLYCRVGSYVVVTEPEPLSGGRKSPFDLDELIMKLGFHSLLPW